MPAGHAHGSWAGAWAVWAVARARAACPLQNGLQPAALEPAAIQQRLAAPALSWSSGLGGGCSVMQDRYRGVATVAAAPLPLGSNDGATQNLDQHTGKQLEGGSSGPGQPDWRSHVRSQFSIRPSLLSPLYSAYQAEQQRHQRASITSRLLDAHSLLASEVDGLDPTQVKLARRTASPPVAHTMRGISFVKWGVVCRQKSLPTLSLSSCKEMLAARYKRRD
jgi:hypothetical protein